MSDMKTYPIGVDFSYCNSYIVICRADRKSDGTPGDYELATRTVFNSHSEAVDYLGGISSSRDPIVVSGRFEQLRFG